jgi:hypothetical protein
MGSVEARLSGMGVARLAIGVAATNTQAISFKRRGAVPFVTDPFESVDLNDGLGAAV